MVQGRHWRRAMILAALLGAVAGAAQGEPYWIAYEGNDYPEREGWWRIWYDIPAERRLEDGCLVMDTLGDPFIGEYYQWPPVGNLDPHPGEVFVMRWRIRIDEVSGSRFDAGIQIRADDGWAAGFRHSEDMIRAVWVFGVEAHFQPWVFHDFEFRSGDMRNYELYIDDQLVLEGRFVELSECSRMSWGQSTSSAGSLTRWDYVRFGVVPEPSTWLIVLVALLCVGTRRI